MATPDFPDDVSGLIVDFDWTAGGLNRQDPDTGLVPARKLIARIPQQPGHALRVALAVQIAGTCPASVAAVPAGKIGLCKDRFGTDLFGPQIVFRHERKPPVTCKECRLTRDATSRFPPSLLAMQGGNRDVRPGSIPPPGSWNLRYRGPSCMR